MNTRPKPSARSRLAAHIQADLITALAVISLTLLPLGYGYVHHRRLVRNATTRAVVLELIDSEMEVLAAGEHRAFAEGSRAYPLRGIAVRDLPPGECTLAKSSLPDSRIHLTLAWTPAREGLLKPVQRGITFKAQP